jgi:hypothetical protein
VSQSSKARLWTGRVISALPVLMLLFSASLKLMKSPQAVQGMVQLGYPANTLIPIGIAELLSTIVYIIPQTSVFGAVLLAAYLGGATATHVHAGQPFFAPVLCGILVWIGLYLREPRLAPLVPLRKM